MNQAQIMKVTMTRRTHGPMKIRNSILDEKYP